MSVPPHFMMWSASPEELHSSMSLFAQEAFESFQATGDINDLNFAVHYATHGFRLTPRDHPELLYRLNNLGVMLQARHLETGDLGDLNTAIIASRRVLEHGPQDHSSRAGWLGNLAGCLHRRYERTGNEIDLQDSVTLMRQALNSTPEDDPYHRARLSTLGVALRGQYLRTGEMELLEESIALERQALDSMPDDYPERDKFLQNLATSYAVKYERTGQLEDLEKGIAITRQGDASTSTNPLDMVRRLNDLGVMLRDRYMRTGQMADLEESIIAVERAIEAIPEDHYENASCLNNLGIGLLVQFERTGRISSLERAIEAARKAVNLTPEDHPNRVARWNILAINLQKRYAALHQIDDLNDAIRILRQAVDETPEDHPSRPDFLGNLGNQLELKYRWTDDISNLGEAIQVARQAVESRPEDHPERAATLFNLGTKLQTRHERVADAGDLEEASTHLQNAWNCLASGPLDRVRAAAQCLKILVTLQRFDQAVELAKAAIDFLPAVNTKLLDRDDQQYVVATFADIAVYLCACFLLSGNTDDALQYLEKGRTIIISTLIDSRSDVSALMEQNPDLAHRYQELRDEVNTPLRQTEFPVVDAQLRQRRLEAMAELNACVLEIRELDGHGRFLLGQTTAEMQKCAGDGAIVIVNVSEFRSDTIIVTATVVKTLHLPRLGARDAQVWLAKDWRGSRKERLQKNKEYLEYLQWLWEACVEQVLDEVRAIFTEPDSLRRIWWIGTGRASSMPFHAAGSHVRGSTENAYNRALSSYTPSIKALAHAQSWARRNEQAEATDRLMLITTMPTSPKGADGEKLADLPGVVGEKNRILKTAGGLITTAVLDYPSADQVLRTLEGCRIAHFACHGTSDKSDPSQSGLILRRNSSLPDDAPEQDLLTVYSISQLQLKHAQIAYLSACSTAENNVASLLSDEVIHVVSGFQIAGFPHVVGCLWPAGDWECAEVATRFYKSVLSQLSSGQGTDAVASALQEAVMAVRADDLGMPLSWAQFVHYGA